MAKYAVGKDVKFQIEITKTEVKNVSLCLGCHKASTSTHNTTFTYEETEVCGSKVTVLSS